MERSKLDWKTFTARRRLDVGAWIKSKGFKSYSEMKKWLTDQDMEPPTKEEVAKHFRKPKAKVEEVIKEIPAMEPTVEESKKTEPSKKKAKKRVDTDIEK